MSVTRLHGGLLSLTTTATLLSVSVGDRSNQVVHSAASSGYNATSTVCNPSQPVCENASGCWIPGQGSNCFGVWTTAWQQECARVPAGLAQQLQDTFPKVLQHIEGGHCPYGRKLLGEVTWPQPLAELSDAVAPLDWLKVVAVGYSYLPFLVGGFVTLSFLVHRGTRQLWVLLYLALQLFITELVLKKWIVPGHPRPGNLMQVGDYSGRYVGSCVDSCGMPSGHSALAMGWFTLLFLDAAVRTHPFQITGQPPLAFSMQGRASLEDGECNECCRTECKGVLKVLQYLVLVPWVDSDKLTHMKFITYMAVWAFIMIPVPFMRVVLYDHSVEQAFIGTLIGPIVAFSWWRIVRHCQRRYVHREGERICFGLLVHNYRLPRFHLTREQQISVNTSSTLLSPNAGDSQSAGAWHVSDSSAASETPHLIPNSFDVQRQDGALQSHPEDHEPPLSYAIPSTHNSSSYSPTAAGDEGPHNFITTSNDISSQGNSEAP